MSGKGASVGAPRAGGPGAPRVLVYVADPRQLEPAAVAPEPPPAAPPPSHADALYLSDGLHQLPRNTLYRHPLDCPDQRNHSNTVFYKTINDNDGKLNVFGAPDNLGNRSEYLPVPQQFLKDPNLKADEVKVNDHLSNSNAKSACGTSVNTDLSAVETFTSRLEVGDLATYQRCSGPIGPEGGIPPMHPVALQSGVECSNSSDRELSRSYVNYQFLEQSVSHQSIVNQSISILNQQVGVSRGIVSEGESGNGAQLVRTADGVVLAVLPSPAVTQATDGAEHSSRTTLGENPQTIVVPLGWRRIVNGSSVVYISPSGTALSALPQLRDYLQTAGTCKCGLPCPLRPETAFNFDPKVVSKPYQASSGAELTKLCNHKRKLLATLQARAHSPATPPPHHIEQKKVTSEVTAVKKKMKKRPGFPPNMTVSQLMVQRDRPLNEFKPQDVDHNRTGSPGVATRPPGPPGPPAYVAQQNILSVQDNDAKQDTHVQRTSHYLTVNSGWITQQQENLDGQKSNRPPSNSPNQHLGLPVLGTNGQLIGVNTSYKQNANYKNVMGMPQNVLEQDTKDEKKDVSMQHNIQPMKHSVKEEESQIYCGLNQPLTPEVMQKINEQQQIFIQQNQKQIEMAMKGYRTQLAENVNLNKSQNQGQQYVPQGQLVIQNGAVVKTNPAKTPPWQVKRNDSNTSNPMASPNLKPHKSENADYDESNANISEDAMNTYNSFQSNEHAMNQAMCSRVPPLPQHYNMLSQQWPNMEVKKKGKNTSKATKKKASAVENKVVTYGSNGMRIMPDSKNEMPNNNVLSFMDDPSGYLAQQTVLLNNTISRQVGMNSSYDANQYEIPNNCYSLQNQTDKSCKPSNKQPCEVANSYRSNMVPNPLPSPNTTPDSSVLSDKGMDNSVPQCCKGCNISMKSNGPDFAENQMRLKYMKQNAYKMELDGTPAISSPNHGFDDNPVTSSTFLDRSPMLSDNCGPIQAGTVSTSNVSPTETLQPPEPSPTLSNSSRSTDTPHSSGGNGSQMQPNCSYPMPSPMYSNQITCKENFNSNPSTPGHLYPYNSPGPPNNQCIGTQMMHFISNHNVNKNLMEVDNISMVGVKPGLKPPQEAYRAEMKRRMENSMPGYCPPPHLGGGPAHSLIQTCYVQTFVTTMASGFSVTRDTVTSVLAGKTSTATTSINASQVNFVRPPPPPSVNLATTYAIPNNQPDPFLNSVNLPTSYPLHIAGTTAQNMISKSPLEMVQNVIGSLPSKSDSNNTHTTTLSQVARRPGHTTPGQILISSTGQIIVSNSQMPPPPPKTSNAASPMHGSSSVTNVTTSVAQMMPGVQPIVNQPTVVVNTLPTPFVIQPSMMSVDGQVVQQNAVLPQIVTAGIVSGQSPNGSPRQMDVKNGQSFVQGVAMLSPESSKKRKKKKNQPANITNVLQITAPQQNPNNLMVHHSSPQHSTSPQFSPRGFQLSPNNNISPTPMLQALTIVPGKSGSPAHIVMNGQGNANNFGSQQIITNTSPSQQINLLQPVNLINNASSVMSNFPAFQQFIVPNLGGMVMTADGTAIIQDNSTGMPMQLQLQTVNGQNVLTPVQNPGMFATGANGGVVIRAQNQQGKMIQSQHSPGAQFLSSNSQVMMNSPNFNGQLSPLLANLSPTSVAFNASPQVRSGNVQQEFIQTNQMGQVMVPLSPKRASIASTNGRGNSTFVQNTTIVQQQTTLVSNSHNAQMASNLPPARLSIDPNLLLGHKASAPKKIFAEAESGEEKDDKCVLRGEGEGRGEGEYAKLMSEFVRHSVSTQTLAARKSPGGGVSPPDTTTHSPLGAHEPARSPRRPPHGHYADTTTESPEPEDASSSAMVQCVSSSEQDMAESREHAWPTPRNDFGTENETQNMMPNAPLMRQSRPHNPVESTELHYNQSMNAPAMNSQHIMPMAPNYYERTYANKQTYKRKNNFGDAPNFRNDKMMRTNYGMVHGLPKETDYDSMGMASPDKAQARQFPTSGPSSDNSAIQKVFDRHNLGSGDDGGSSGGSRAFAVGDVVWGPVRGHASWPGTLEARAPAGRWRVRWFGGRAPAPVPAARLLTLSEGLEAHHAASTAHRKSRKLNTLLENAIQEAMAELDKKSERSVESQPEATNEEAIADCETITETPKRSRKNDKVKTKEKVRKTSSKLAPTVTKSGESTRLRSSR